MGAAESVTGNRTEVVDDVLTLTQLHGGLVGDFTNPPEVGIQLADASLYAADGLWKPEGVPGSRRQRGGPFFSDEVSRRNLWVNCICMSATGVTRLRISLTSGA